MNVERGLWLEGLVAGLATLVVAWPIVDLLREPTWLDGALPVILVVVVTGGLLRTFGVNPSATVLLQTLAALVVMWWRYLPETLWYGLPTRDTADQAAALLQEAGTVLQTYAAPAPTTQGVEFLVVAMLGLCALSVDAIGVTGRAPATAGLPLVAAFMVSVSNTGRAMEPQYFIAATGIWLLMMAQQGDRIVGSWSSADRRESVGSHDVSHGPTGHRTVARVIGVATVVGALLVASLLPHLPPYLLGEGLARNPDARGGGGEGSVSFTETMDLTADLNSRSQEPVIRYRTNSGLLEPLRVTAASVFADGEWQPPDYDSNASQGSSTFTDDPAAQLAEGVPVGEAEIRVVNNNLEPPFLAVPYPLLNADLGVGWVRDAGTDALRVENRPTQYRAEYLQVAARGELPEGLGDAPVTELPPRYLEVDEEAAPTIDTWVTEVVGDETNTLAAASLLQNHLRSGTYTYSLDLLDNETGVDPITHFLQTRQGYCVQFATAMVMGARSLGIPARMAVGFLAGERQEDGSWVVLAADAHTWPELYVDGLGWTRFEPTPGTRSGPSPAYARQDVGPTEAEPTLGAEPTAPEQPVDESPEAGADQDLWSTLAGWLPILGRALLVVLVLALLMAVVPWAGRRYREAAVRAARTPEERVEGQWLLLTRSLEDLGIAPPEERSPRQMRAHYAEHAHLDRRSREALGRVTATLERSRYAPPATDDPARAKQVSLMGHDVRSVVDAVREALPWNIRTNAALLPRSGVRWIRDRARSLLTRR